MVPTSVTASDPRGACQAGKECVSFRGRSDLYVQYSGGHYDLGGDCVSFSLFASVQGRRVLEQLVGYRSRLGTRIWLLQIALSLSMKGMLLGHYVVLLSPPNLNPAHSELKMR
jgi:hypothetical protein